MTKMLKDLRQGDIIEMELGTWNNKGRFIFKEMKPAKYGYLVIVQPCGYYLDASGNIEKWFGSEREIIVNSLRDEFEIKEF